MYLNLIRQPPEGNAVRGKLYIADPLAPLGWRASSECSKRVVPAGRERGFSTLENLDYIIPPGIYPLTVTYSPKFKRPMPLITNVQGRSGIRIHPGTRPEHSRGCVLVKTRAEEEAIKDLILSNNINRIEIFSQ